MEGETVRVVAEVCRRLDGLPRQGIGRPCKAGKEEIIGLRTALDLFIEEGDAKRHARWLADAQILYDGLATLSGVEVVLTGGDDITSVPTVALRFPRDETERAGALIRALLDRTSAIHVGVDDYERGIVTFSPICLGESEAEIVALAVQIAI